LAAEGGFAGAVLDAGCGTGENALHVASLGLPVLGFDVAETALAMAREKAGHRGIRAEFVAADALQLEGLGRRFETVLDCGLRLASVPGRRAVEVRRIPGQSRHPFVTGGWPAAERIVGDGS